MSLNTEATMTSRAGHAQGTTRRPTADLRSPTIVNIDGTASVHLTLAVCDYEHVREITQGIVRADGITLTRSRSRNMSSWTVV